MLALAFNGENVDEMLIVLVLHYNNAITITRT